MNVIDDMVEAAGLAIFKRRYGGDPLWPVGIDKNGRHQEPYVSFVPTWKWKGCEEDARLVLEAALASPVGQIAEGGRESKIADLVRSVAEWDDRTSPDDYPDHLLLTPQELTEFARCVAALSAAPASPANGWQKHYDRPEHLALDLRQIADNADHRAGFATMDAQILRRAAACFDRLPEDIDLREAREALRSLPTPPNGGAV